VMPGQVNSDFTLFFWAVQASLNYLYSRL
jgi:hypothetical protein